MSRLAHMALRRVDQTAPQTVSPSGGPRTQSVRSPTIPGSGYVHSADELRLGPSPQPLVDLGDRDVSDVAGAQAFNTSVQYVSRAFEGTLDLGGADAMAIRSVARDELGMTHVRLERIHQGLPVFPEQVVVHLDKDGTP